MTMAGQLDLDAVTLDAGPHGHRVDGVNLLEAVAWWAGEPHTDRPVCVSPVLARFAGEWAEALDHQPRQRLKRLVPALAGTAADGADRRRVLMLADWLVHTCAPAFLQAAGLADMGFGTGRPVDGWEPAVRALLTADVAGRVVHHALERAWAVRPGSRNAPSAASQATGAAGTVAARLAIAAGLGGGPLERAGLVESLTDALAVAHHPGADPGFDAVERVAVWELQTAIGEVIDGAALVTALQAPPDGEWSALLGTRRQLQDSALVLLERLCAAGKEGP
jgi:hypothetical protein